MKLSRPQKISYGIIAVLAVAFIGVLSYLQLQGPDRSAPLQERPLNVGGLNAAEARQAFDVGILSDERYRSLDHSLFDAGRLPVPVPQARGKPNLF